MKRTVAITGVWIVLAVPLLLGQSKRDPLTEQQIEDVREAGDQPVQRIKLFVGYVEERSKGIHDINADVRAQNKTVRLHNLYDEFTHLSDDLEDNMDNFNDQHEDLRKELKEVVDKTGQWGTALNEPPASNQYDFVRKSALEANQSVHDSAVQMIADEEKYFAEKKKEAKAAEKAAEKSETR
jgi:hypothetical protein